MRWLIIILGNECLIHIFFFSMAFLFLAQTCGVANGRRVSVQNNIALNYEISIATTFPWSPPLFDGRCFDEPHSKTHDLFDYTFLPARYCSAPGCMSESSRKFRIVKAAAALCEERLR
jgi:hypothetical protein